MLFQPGIWMLLLVSILTCKENFDSPLIPRHESKWLKRHPSRENVESLKISRYLNVFKKISNECIYLISQAEIRILVEIVSAKMLWWVNGIVMSLTFFEWHRSHVSSLKVFQTLIPGSDFPCKSTNHSLDIYERTRLGVNRREKNRKNKEGKLCGLIKKDYSNIIMSNNSCFEKIRMGDCSACGDSLLATSAVWSQANFPEIWPVELDMSL